MDGSLQNKKNMGPNTCTGVFFPKRNQWQSSKMCTPLQCTDTCSNCLEKSPVWECQGGYNVHQSGCNSFSDDMHRCGPSPHHPTNVCGISGALSLDTDGLIWPGCVCSNDNAAVTHKSHWPGVPPYTSLSASQCINANFCVCVGAWIAHCQITLDGATASSLRAKGILFSLEGNPHDPSAVVPSHSYVVSNFRCYIEDIHLTYKMSDNIYRSFYVHYRVTRTKRPHATLRKEGGKSYGEALSGGISWFSGQ